MNASLFCTTVSSAYVEHPTQGIQNEVRWVEAESGNDEPPDEVNWILFYLLSSSSRFGMKTFN